MIGFLWSCEQPKVTRSKSCCAMMSSNNIGDVIPLHLCGFSAKAASYSRTWLVFLMHRCISVYLPLSTDTFKCSYIYIYIRAHGQVYTCMHAVTKLLHSRAFQLGGFTSFQSLFCSFSKNGKGLQPELGKKRKTLYAVAVLADIWESFVLLSLLLTFS